MLNKHDAAVLSAALAVTKKESSHNTNPAAWTHNYAAAKYDSAYRALEDALICAHAWGDDPLARSALSLPDHEPPLPTPTASESDSSPESEGATGPPSDAGSRSRTQMIGDY